MPEVICAPCYDCKYTDCVIVCPVECFYQDERMLYIHPVDCIECEACIPECPVEAIFHEASVPAHWQHFIHLNSERATALKDRGEGQITSKDTPLEGPACKKRGPKVPLTEAEWLADTDLYRMLDLVKNRFSGRKMELFGIACVRQNWDRVVESIRVNFEERERDADEKTQPLPGGDGPASFAWQLALSCAGQTARQCRMLRCIFGNPFRPLLLHPSWLNPTVVQLAHAAYEER
jgi:ferredoxin